MCYKIIATVRVFVTIGLSVHFLNHTQKKKFFKKIIFSKKDCNRGRDL